jgi:NCS1 family nucleobase:cation symporter-1
MCAPQRSQIVVVLRGMEAIRLVEKYSAPILIALSLALLVR